MSLKVIPHSAFTESNVGGKNKTVLTCAGGGHNGRNLALDTADAVAGNEFIVGDWREQHNYKVFQVGGNLTLLPKYETAGYGGTNT